MVLIVSEHLDSSTNRVIDWLSYYGEQIVRINIDDFLTKDSTHMYASLSSDVPGPTIKLGLDEIEVDSIWFRRSVYSSFPNENMLSDIADQHVRDVVKTNLYYEYLNSSLFFFASIKNVKRRLGSSESRHLNKLNVLQMAKASGLRIPHTIVTNKKDDVKTFLKTE